MEEKDKKNTLQDENQEMIVFENQKGKNSKQQILEILKFLAFSLSAGVIQILTFELLYTWIACLPWWPSYLISIVLSVIWNFTFNRKFTFKSSSNIPIAMILVVIYYCAFISLSVFGGDALERIGWDGTLVTVIMMIINFVTEYIYDKFVVFNDKLVNKIANKFGKNKNKNQ